MTLRISGGSRRKAGVREPASATKVCVAGNLVANGTDRGLSDRTMTAYPDDVSATGVFVLRSLVVEKGDGVMSDLTMTGYSASQPKRLSSASFLASIATAFSMPWAAAVMIPASPACRCVSDGGVVEL